MWLLNVVIYDYSFDTYSTSVGGPIGSKGSAKGEMWLCWMCRTPTQVGCIGDVYIGRVH